MIKVFLIAILILFSSFSYASSHGANFGKTPVSRNVRIIANWIIQSKNNADLPFVIIDKINAKVYAFTVDGRLLGSARALLGIAIGDDTTPGIGGKALSDIPISERTTPAGRFVSFLGEDSHNTDIVWVDYNAGVAMHRVITSNPKEQRLYRLSTPFLRDKRISYGCINVPVQFYDKIIHPMFLHNQGVVYILPETHPLRDFFNVR